MMWFGGCSTEDPYDDFTKAGKDSEVYWEWGLEGICDKRRTGDHMITHFQYYLCHFKNMKVIYTNSLRQEYNILMITIWRASLYAFLIREPGTVRVNITIMRNMGIMTPRKS